MLTPSQTLALDLSYHTAIMANAGSGKTYVLVERYLKILEQNPEMHPRNIVAITFTDSAARDLKKKITERIKERISSGNDGVAQKRLREIRQQLNSSEISTIHAFCTNLLRAYPEEAGVDATFTVVTNPEDEILRNDCVRSVFFQSISEEYHHDDGSNSSPLLSLFRLFGRKRLDELMRSLLKSRFKVKITTDNLYSSPDAFILTTWSSKMEAFLVEQLPTKEEVVIFMDFFNGPKLNKKQLEASESLQQYILTQSKLEDLFAYKVLVDKFFTQKNEIRKQVIPFESLLDKYSSLSEKTIRLRREYEPMLDAYLASIRNPLAQQQYLIYCRSILNLYERVLEEYSNQKSNYGLLDYDDLIERALRLVQNVDVREELTKRYKHILIDEYQDTDAAQYEIAKALTGSLESTNTLTIVGDPKQAIYSFRNADLELYFQTLKEISKFASGGESPIVLAESFRMLSIPLAFINIVTTGLFEDAVSQTPQPGLALLVEGRGSTRTGTVEIIYKRFENNLSEKLSGEVEDIQATDDQVDSAEAELIALKIKEIIRDNSGKYVVEDRTEEHPEHNNLRYGDIAILLRKRKKQPELETAFRAHGIPFTTYAGQGYYERSEVTDITNFLTFLVNPDDDIALAGLLRSPYFAFSDVDLYKIAPERGSVANLWRRLALHISSKDELHFDRAINILSKNLQLVGRISTELLLQNIIAESGILGILESMPGAEQRSANLEKYTQLAISFGKEGFTGTFDFVERINLLMEKDEMEAQAEVRKDTNAVHIMTIHNSKGLEFPVVVLPFLHSKVTQKDSRRVWSVIDKEYGLGIELPEADHSQPIVEYIKIQEQEKNIAEEKRIFYVAMTRARDHLILSASPKNKITEASCLSWVLNSLGEDNLDDERKEIRVRTTINRYRESSEPKVFPDLIEFPIPIIRSDADIFIYSDLPLDSLAPIHDSVYYLEEVEPSTSTARYSPSQILTYKECPTKYYLRYQLGLPEEPRLPYFNESDTFAESVQGTLVGQVIHKMLEHGSELLTGGIVDELKLGSILHSVSDELRLPNRTRALIEKRVKSDILIAFSTEIAKRAFGAEPNFTEIAIRSKVDDGQILSGIIDRLFMDDEGIWNVLDYKTDTRENEEKRTRHEFQVEFYSYLVSKLHNADRVRAHILYTHSGHTFSKEFNQNTFLGTRESLTAFILEIRAQKNAASLEKIRKNYSHCQDCQYFNQSDGKCIAGLGIITQ